MRFYLNRMRNSGSIARSFLLCFVGVQFTACFDIKEMPQSCEPTPYERQVCYFPLTPEVDSTLDSGVWQNENLHWEKVDETLYVSAPELDPPDDEKDASFEFACVADNAYIYLKYKITDEKWLVDPAPPQTLLGR
jgi:hypothetical protein